MTKEEKKDELKNRISMALKDPTLQQGFEIICRELADLQKEVVDLRRDKEDLIFVRNAKADHINELKETLAQTIENDEVAYETLKLHDQEEVGMLNSKVTELENKIADIKANCDLAIEGRDIKIKELELELTVEKDQHQEEINLHLHAEEYIKSLEKEISILLSCKNCPENKGGYICEKEYNDKCLSQKIQYIKELQEEIAKLEEQIEKMKCCGNCKHDYDEEQYITTDYCNDCFDFNKWEVNFGVSN